MVNGERLLFPLLVLPHPVYESIAITLLQPKVYFCLRLGLP